MLKERLSFAPTFCGLLIILVGAYTMFFGDKTVVLPSSVLIGSVVVCFGGFYLIKWSTMVLFDRLEKLEKIVEKLGGNQDERTEDP